MPRTASTAGHSHAFAPMESDGKQLDDNSTHASGQTTLDGSLTTKYHSHDWHMWWNGDKKKFEVQFSPGGSDRHTHEDMELENF